MRWLFLFILFLNLAYIGWQVSRSPEDSYVGIKSLQGKPIVLLSEAKSLVTEEETAAIKKISDLDKPVPLVVEASDKKLQKNTQAVASERTPKPEPLEVSKKVVEEVKVSSVSPVLSESPLAQCFEIGPFRALDTLSGLTQEIKPYVTTTSFHSREANGPTVYWVYIKPEKNRSKAIEVGKRLKAKKIKDFYVIRNGEKVNGLS